MRERKRFVVDATVGARWFLVDEPLYKKSRILLSELILGNVELSAPAIFRHEVTGALKRACATRGKNTKRPRIQARQALESLKLLYELPVQIHADTYDETLAAFDMALRFSKGHYDMLYLRLAQKLGGQFITADERVIEAVPKDFPRGSVCLLADWVF